MLTAQPMWWVVGRPKGPEHGNVPPCPSVSASVVKSNVRVSLEASAPVRAPAFRVSTTRHGGLTGVYTWLSVHFQEQGVSVRIGPGLHRPARDLPCDVRPGAPLPVKNLIRRHEIVRQIRAVELPGGS